ncbi:MOSC N-terminal beta barrel domain-containing protein [Solirubrobacter sp. CPCC 204708]|uniref:MOSC N-terminal beta barrel domain-containing protein n=1 Tax=Solirubrobacter deserti TaxID=2282478 RepID=A0ABT4RDR0_9ACTN|nr:MOSC N-terminal beta barrel domain-containing protein [Solirubrobacter deserti]MBE2314667.1 MOSC N-terminal beta barrel domain-containing protein [Solirubrobacter deserti]MDA0136674.1 MOSC N-terminal beta barrel domain-containing protein [Solirubrobacter deserti]
MTSGFVQGLWRFPVVGMAGEQLRSTQIDARGVAGDRQHYAAGPEGRLSVQDLPELAQWSAAYPFYPDGAIDPHKPAPYPTLTHAGKAFLWGDPRLEFALQRSLGRTIDLVRDLDHARGVIVATVAPPMQRAIAGVNVQLGLRLPEGGGWGGTELIFRDGVRLKLVASRADGPGIEARVVEAGRIVLGEPVTLG